ncbi:MAG: hypothetical protein ACR2J8_09965 [Thermomicrobiales bacterium]
MLPSSASRGAGAGWRGVRWKPGPRRAPIAGNARALGKARFTIEPNQTTQVTVDLKSAPKAQPAA